MSDPWADQWPDADANGLGCYLLALSEMRSRHMTATVDENGASYGTRAIDPASGLYYIIDFRTKERVYQLARCTDCGMTPWSSVPSAEDPLHSV